MHRQEKSGPVNEFIFYVKLDLNLPPSWRSFAGVFAAYSGSRSYR